MFDLKFEIPPSIKITKEFNPRSEKTHYYQPEIATLRKLGYQPSSRPYAVILRMISECRVNRGRIDPGVFKPKIGWKS